jgi:[protein-PII] uridylyltransferase
LTAQVFTRSDGVALDEFFVNDARTGNLATREQHDKFAALLERVLGDEEIDLRALIKKQILSQTFYQPYAGEQMETRISFDNEISEARTLIEIETEDRLGLLYAISQAFAGLAVDIAGARIVTERGAAIDSFYVRELAGGKIESPSRRAVIETKLLEVIGRLETVVETNPVQIIRAST